jgi:hypothetical protein
VCSNSLLPHLAFANWITTLTVFLDAEKNIALLANEQTATLHLSIPFYVNVFITV